MIITTALAFFMRFRKNPRMDTKPPSPDTSHRSQVELPPPGTSIVTNQQAKAIAEKIYADWSARFTPAACQQLTEAVAKGTAARLAAIGGTSYTSPQLDRDLHSSPPQPATPPLSRRAAKGKGTAQKLMAELWSEFAPTAVFHLSQKLTEINQREQKSRRVQKQIERAAGSGE